MIKPGKTTQALDLSSLDTSAACDKAYELELLHPVTAQPLGQFVSVVGKDSDTFISHIRDKVNGKLRAEAFAKRRNKPIPVETMEDRERESIETLAACTTGFRNIDFGGPLSFSYDNAVKLYSGLRFVRTQVDEAIDDLSNFMPG